MDIVSSSGDEDSEEDDENEMAEDEVYLVKMSQFLKDYEE